MRVRQLAVMAGIAVAVMTAPAAAQERQDSTEIERLKRQIEAITRELEEMRLGTEVVREADTSVLGFGPAASKVYRVGRGVSIGGYGEVLYENFRAAREDGTPSGAVDRLDALRGIIYVGYKFSDQWIFNSEIEIEHGSTSEGGSVSLEFAYLDYRLSPAFGLRAGLLLPPMGFLNELHEPPIFLGATRPETEQRIIPSTWRENGLGVFGEAAGVSYRAYVVNGLEGAGFSAAGLRGGRQKGADALAEHFAGVGRIDYTGILGLTVGASAYYGNSGQDLDIGVRTVIGSGHAEYRAHGLSLRGLVAVADLDDVADLNAAIGASGTGSVGERLLGWYLEAGYDVLRHLETSHQLIPYVRYERLNTQDEVPAGFTADPATDRRILVLGAAWKPIPRIALKGDYQVHGNEADTGVDRFALALGYLF